MTTLEQRIERAARALAPEVWTETVWHQPEFQEFLRMSSTEEAEEILRAAVPELFTDPPTHWLAPMEPTETMKHDSLLAFVQHVEASLGDMPEEDETFARGLRIGAVSGRSSHEMGVVYAAMRKAYTSKDTAKDG